MFGLNKTPPPLNVPPAPRVQADGRFTPESCGNCKYAVELPEAPNSHTYACRRYPPTWVTLGLNPNTGSPIGQGVFPATEATMWCGEYARRQS